MIAVAVLSAAANVTGNGDIPTNIGYLVFGLFWLLSCLTKEPLCAAYRIPGGVAPSVGKIKKRNLFKKFSKESIKFN